VDAWHVVTQWHQPAGGTLCRDPQNAGNEIACPHVPMGFNLQNWDKSRSDRPPGATGETLDFGVGDKASTKTTGSVSLWHENLQKGTWYEFLLHVYWRACGNTNDELNVRYDPNGKCVKERDAFQEMWIRHWDVNGRPKDLIPIYMPKYYHYNLDERYIRNGAYFGCDATDSEWQTLCKDPAYNGAVFMRQGLYHCSPFIHQYCPGSGMVGPGEPIPCDPRAVSQCPPTNRAPSNIPPTPLQTMYYDGMEYLKCSSNKIPSALKNVVCDVQH
jgi:hypothetical protein